MAMSYHDAVSMAEYNRQDLRRQAEASRIRNLASQGTDHPRHALQHRALDMLGRAMIHLGEALRDRSRLAVEPPPTLVCENH
jgi:hypothetical protein